MKIVVGINTLTSIDQPVYSNHCQFWFRLGRSSSHDFILSHPRRMSIDNMRNMTAKIALEHNADYILFIDDDVLIPLNTVDMLLASNADIAAGWTLIRGYPFKNMFFKFVDEEKTQLENVKEEDLTICTGNFLCDAVGFSCTLIKVDLLRKIKVPYFVTGPYNTEDIYFCIKAVRAVPETKIVVNLDCKTSHNLGSEYIDPLNKKYYKEYYEKIYPEVMTRKEAQPSQQHEEADGSLTYEEVLGEAVFK
jgi:GT2 family glycosyltransferase